MRFWVNTYHPLASSPGGPWESWTPQPPSFADASCRREPDLEAAHPAITGLCRTYAVRVLSGGDLVAYFGVKFPYFGQASHRRLTAVLRVIEECRSHLQAGDWYRARKEALPRNLMLPGNDPLPLGMTEGFYRPPGARGRQDWVRPTGPSDHERVVREWNELYARRRGRCQDVRVCEIVFRDINQGRIVNDAVISDVFDGSFPNTEHRPREIGAHTMRTLLMRCDIALPPELLA